MATGISYVQQQSAQILTLCSEGVMDVLTALSVRIIRNLQVIQTQLSALNKGRVSPGEPGSPHRTLLSRIFCEHGFEPIAPACTPSSFQPEQYHNIKAEGGFGSPTKFEHHDSSTM